MYLAYRRHLSDASVKLLVMDCSSAITSHEGERGYYSVCSSVWQYIWLCFFRLHSADPWEHLWDDEVSRSSSLVWNLSAWATMVRKCFVEDGTCPLQQGPLAWMWHPWVLKCSEWGNIHLSGSCTTSPVLKCWHLREFAGSRLWLGFAVLMVRFI